MLEYVIAAEMTIVTGLLCCGVGLMILVIQKVKGTVGPIIGLVNQFERLK